MAKYLDFENIFLKELIIKLFKYLDINKYNLKLEVNNELFYRQIHSLSFIEWETSKTYIKIYLINNLPKL